MGHEDDVVDDDPRMIYSPAETEMTFIWCGEVTHPVQVFLTDEDHPPDMYFLLANIVNFDWDNLPTPRYLISMFRQACDLWRKQYEENSHPLAIEEIMKEIDKLTGGQQE